MLVLETSRNSAAEKLWPQGDCYADADLSCAAPNENGYVVTCLHLKKQILVSN